MTNDTVIGMEERLRTDAVERLKLEVTTAFSPVRRLLTEYGEFFPVEGLKQKNENHVGMALAVDLVGQAVIKALTPKREQDAIDGFLKQVTTLQDQVDALFEQFNQNVSI